MIARRRTQQSAVGTLLMVLASGALVAAGPSTASASPAAPAAAAYDGCVRPAKGFTPTKASIPAIGRTVKVIKVKRTKSGAVGAGPVTESGKWLMAMDPKSKPASRKGSVILSGHTWPDGSALGNAMLRNLQEGHSVVLRGKDGKQACYQIRKRKSYAVRDVPNKKAFRAGGPEQLVIVTCSGKRTSPGNWSRRTIWYAVPVVPAGPPAPPPAPPVEQAPPSLLGNLLGGLLGGR